MGHAPGRPNLSETSAEPVRAWSTSSRVASPQAVSDLYRNSDTPKTSGHGEEQRLARIKTLGVHNLRN
jgi:hypothetical protein